MRRTRSGRTFSRATDGACDCEDEQRGERALHGEGDEEVLPESVHGEFSVAGRSRRRPSGSGRRSRRDPRHSGRPPWTAARSRRSARSSPPGPAARRGTGAPPWRPRRRSCAAWRSRSSRGAPRGRSRPRGEGRPSSRRSGRRPSRAAARRSRKSPVSARIATMGTRRTHENFAARLAPSAAPAAAQRPSDRRSRARAARTSVPKKPRAAARSVCTTPACARRFGSKATQRGRENSGEVAGPRPHGPAGDDDEKEEQRRHRRARDGEERLGAQRRVEAEGPRLLGRGHGERDVHLRRAPPGRPDREARQELHERRVLEVRVVRARDRVFRRGERVERLVHRGAVEARMVEDERRAGRREKEHGGPESHAATLDHPAIVGGGSPTPVTLSGVSARSGGLSRDGRFVLLMFLAALALRLATVPGCDLPRLAPPFARLLRAPSTDRFGRAELSPRPVSRSVPEPSGRRRLHLASRVRPRRGRSRARPLRARGDDGRGPEGRGRPSRAPGRASDPAPFRRGAAGVRPAARADRDRRLRRAPRGRPLGRLRPLRSSRGRGSESAPGPRGRRVGRGRARQRAIRARRPLRSRDRSRRPHVAGGRVRGRPLVPVGRARARRGRRRRGPRGDGARRPRSRGHPSGGARALLVRLLRLVPARASRGRDRAAARALASWRAPTARRRALWGLLAALGLGVALPNARRVLESVFHGGAYVFKGGAGAPADDFADGGFLSYPPEFLRLVAECQPLVRGWSSFERAVREVSPGFLLVPVAASCGSGRRSGGRFGPGPRRASSSPSSARPCSRWPSFSSATSITSRSSPRSRSPSSSRGSRRAGSLGARGRRFRSPSPRASSSCRAFRTSRGRWPSRTGPDTTSWTSSRDSARSIRPRSIRPSCRRRLPARSRASCRPGPPGTS